MASAIEQAILDTVSFFDIFDYPLTKEELFRYLYSRDQAVHTRDEFEKAFSGSALRTKLFFHKGFIGFSGREDIVQTRLERNEESKRKLQLVTRFVKVAKHLPFVEMIAVTNNLAFFNAKEESDLDFFIITTAGKLPTARAFLLTVATLFFRRPTSLSHKDTICLPFIVDRTHIDLSSLKLPGGDVYLSYWLATLQPLYVREKNLVHELEGSNKELLSYLGNYSPKKFSLPEGTGSSLVKVFMEVLARLLPVKLLSTWQVKKLSQQTRGMMNTTTSVIITSGVFKIHTRDRRSEYQKRWFDKAKPSRLR